MSKLHSNFKHIFLINHLKKYYLKVRLQRQALEWSGGYRFWSCADVDITKPGINSELDQGFCAYNGDFTGNY
jgi:hypothetical protein